MSVDYVNFSGAHTINFPHYVHVAPGDFASALKIAGATGRTLGADPLAPFLALSAVLLELPTPDVVAVVAVAMPVEELGRGELALSVLSRLHFRAFASYIFYS